MPAGNHRVRKKPPHITELQDRFCQEMAKPDAVQQQAAIDAGYAAGGSNSNAVKLMKRPEIRERIEHYRTTVHGDLLRKENRDKKRRLASAADVVEMLSAIALVDVDDLMDVNGNFMHPKQWPGYAKKAAQKIKITRSKIPTGNPDQPFIEQEEVTIEFGNRVSAGDKLMKHFGMYAPGARIDVDEEELVKDTSIPVEDKHQFGRKLLYLVSQAKDKAKTEK